MKSTQLQKKVLLVLIMMVLAGLGLSVGIALYTCDWEGLFLNFGTELLGAAVTYYLFDRVIRRMEEFEVEKEELEAKKADLIARMGSKRQDVAVAAAEELARYGWLYDGSLQGVNLGFANLQGADLCMADLQGASLSGARLQGAWLSRARLQGAVALGANLQGAELDDAKLQGAYLNWAYLSGANLSGADLSGANLIGADLGGANLQGANLNEDTTLPDGTKWTPDTDMARFTEPKHADFWRPPDTYYELMEVSHIR